MNYEFYVIDGDGCYGVFSENGNYIVVKQSKENPFATTYPMDSDPTNWINTVLRYNKKPITAEQQKTVNTFREQIAQLDSSIKINEQTIEHHQRMIGNYKQRQNDLLEKIAEITGEDSPSVVKAKEMKAELAKLKKGNV